MKLITNQMQLYKYIPFKFVVSLLESNSLFLNSIMQWEDSYENFLLKQNFMTTKKNPVGENIIKKCFSGFYGQSWTDIKSSDAMWRIYSCTPKSISHTWDLGNVAIRVESSTEQLKSLSTPSTWGVEMRKIRYVSNVEIKECLDDLPVINRHNMTKYILESLFMKRVEFQHESEVRLFVHVPSTEKIHNSITIPVIPNDIISEFVVDPRLTDEQYNMIKMKLIECGAKENTIRKSKLYDLYKTTLVVDAQS